MSLSKPIDTGWLGNVATKLRALFNREPVFVTGGAFFTAATVYLVYNNSIIAKQANDVLGERKNYQRNGNKKRKTLVDKHFIEKMKSLMKIIVPGWNSSEGRYLMIFSAFLVARTYLSILVADVNGSIVKAIVKKDFNSFVRRLIVLASFSIPSSTVNSMLKFLSAKLSLKFRSRLVDHFNETYLHPMMYYKVTNVDNRISNPDQALTNTIDEWAKALSTLYSDVTKPLLDIILFSYRLASVLGYQGPLTVIVYYWLSGVIYRLVSPPFGKLTSRSQDLEGEFRRIHNRLITYAEEVAFYGGHNKERQTINDAYDNIRKHESYLIDRHFYMGYFHGFLVKYGSFVLAYSVLGMPVFGKNSEAYIKSVHADPSAITGDYIRNSSLYINLARAIGKIVVAYISLQKLAGYTSVVTDLQDVLCDLRNNKYTREMVKPEVLKAKGLAPGSGTVQRDEIIRFKNLDVVTPNGDILVENVNLEIKDGMNLMITGPNGCGKSSLFRILGGLWPIFGGEVFKPEDADMFYIPQKPYLTVGTLRDQVIYPHLFEEYKAAGHDDDELHQLLTLAQADYIIDREGGWDKIDDWSEVLSGGEKQQIALARLIYHKPKYAILDECSSQLSVDLERFMYTHCKEIGINLITVSHRPTVWKYHEYLLKFDGRGNWELGPMILPDEPLTA